MLQCAMGNSTWAKRSSPVKLSLLVLSLSLYLTACGERVPTSTPAPGTPVYIITRPVGPPVGSPAAPGGNSASIPVTNLPSVTPLPISRVTDLANSFPDAQKQVVIVRHTNNDYEEFLISNDISTDLDGLRQLMGLRPGDTIVADYPLVPTHSTPPPPTPVVPRPAAPTADIPRTPAGAGTILDHSASPLGPLNVIENSWVMENSGTTTQVFVGARREEGPPQPRSAMQGIVVV